MKCFLSILCLFALIGVVDADEKAPLGDEIRVGQLVSGGGLYRSFYPNALPSLLRHIRKTTSANVSADAPFRQAHASSASSKSGIRYLTAGCLLVIL